MFRLKTALITGITGQDGAYLSRFLLNKKYKVVGFVRENDDFSKLEYLKIKESLIFVKCNLLDLLDVKKYIEIYRLAEIYNFAAQSSVTLSFKDPYDTFNFNINSVINLLEAIRLVDTRIRFFQASSCEMFGNVEHLPVNENTPFNPLNPYSASKVAAHTIVNNYKKNFNLFTCCGILFHHESYLRGNDFFVKKIVKQAVEIKKGKRDVLQVGNLEVKRDFGYAPAYVQAMWGVLQQNIADDYIISSGRSICLKDIVYYVFDKLGIDKSKIIENKILFRSSDIKETLGDSSKIKKRIKWNYSMSFYEVLDILLDEEINNFNKSQIF